MIQFSDAQYRVLEEAVYTFGDNQLGIVIEEMAELTKELSKAQRGIERLENIAEEMADVLIMMEQLLIMYNNERFVEAWAELKINRLKKRLED